MQILEILIADEMWFAKYRVRHFERNWAVATAVDSLDAAKQVVDLGKVDVILVEPVALGLADTVKWLKELLDSADRPRIVIESCLPPGFAVDDPRWLGLTPKDFDAVFPKPTCGDEIIREVRRLTGALV